MVRSVIAVFTLLVLTSHPSFSEYPAPPNPSVSDIQKNIAYEFKLLEDKKATIKVTFTGTHTGATAMVHERLEGGRILPVPPHVEHDLGQDGETWTWEIPAKEFARGYYVSGWKYIHEGPEPWGWFQVPLENPSAWDNDTGGSVAFTAAGPVGGPTHIVVVIRPEKTH